MQFRINNAMTSFWWWWVGINAAGFGIGMLIFPIMLNPNFLAFTGISAIVITSLIIFGATATGQAMLLRRYVPDIVHWHWIVATLASVILVTFLQNQGAYFFPFLRYGGNSFLIFSRGDTYFGTGLGFVIGLFQWFVLRRHFQNASWWIVINTIAFAIAVPFAVNAGLSGSAYYITNRIGGATSTLISSEAAALGGALAGAITGLGLIWFISREYPATSTEG